MDALRDSHWLLGNPIWWGLEDKLPPDLRNGELKPPKSWNYSSPREDDKGWKRQRLKPLAYALLKPISWSLFFLIIVPVPLVFNGQTPNDQLFALLFFIVSWSLVIYPLENSRINQLSPITGFFSLPIDWIPLLIGLFIFPVHILIDPRIGWISYVIFWIAMFRTIKNIQLMMNVPPARFLLPILTEEWDSSVLDNQWSIKSKKWKKGLIANYILNTGQLTISGISRGKDKFLSISFLHKSGFLNDPFFEINLDDKELTKILQKPPKIEGIKWPEKFLVSSEEE